MSTTDPEATPTKASFFARCKKSFGAAGVVLVTNIGSDLPAIFGMIGAQHADPVTLWTDAGILVSTTFGAFYATWRLTNAKADGTPNVDSAAG